MRRSDLTLTIALCSSLVAHAILLDFAAARYTRDARKWLWLPGSKPGQIDSGQDPKELASTKEAEPKTRPLPLISIPPMDDQIGERNATGEAIHSAPGDEDMQAPKADEVQAFLSRDPAGPGNVMNLPSNSIVPEGENGRGGNGAPPEMVGLNSPPAKVQPQPKANPPVAAPKVNTLPVASADPAGAVASATPTDNPLDRATANPPAPTVKADAAPRTGDVTPGDNKPNDIVSKNTDPRKGQTDPAAKDDPGDKPDAVNTAAVDDTAHRPPPPAAGVAIAPPDMPNDPKMAASGTASDGDPTSKQQLAMNVPDNLKSAPQVPTTAAAPALPLPQPAAKAPPPAPPPAQAFSQATPAPMVVAIALPTIQQNPPAPSPGGQSGTGPTGKPGAPVAAADPAPQSETESDPFGHSKVIVYKNGKVNVQAGRKMKTVRPRFSLAASADLFGSNGATVVVAADVDTTGTVTHVDLIRSSGTADIDLPCLTAVQEWWIEPLKNKDGKPVPDVAMITLNFVVGR